MGLLADGVPAGRMMRLFGLASETLCSLDAECHDAQFLVRIRTNS